MTTTESWVAEARERLALRARREGLAAVGYAVIDSPVGPLWVAVGPQGVSTIHFGREPSAWELRRLVRLFGAAIVPDRARVSRLARELDQYFAGRRRAFEVPADLRGLTPFQGRVLRRTSRIAYGDLATYKTVARSAGNERASRAAGAAVGSNPIPIVVPCHRVVASDGTLGGYGGGLDVKRRLLALERSEVPAGGWPKARA
ncbi:MAG: methylated-DNA--[protein]-cysteine S-methyltransferase [Chloroflexota bacterium]|nr:methylated-DNA--[protein]-cysteine S-methyltransferase [Chloroflexota bacterium]MDE3192408.1 methylated-DNA--[protein]-cysteine S-methyltransferase [Chloroflexota bacterium]